MPRNHSPTTMLPITLQKAQLLTSLFRRAIDELGYDEQINIKGDPNSLLKYSTYRPGGIYDEQWDWDAYFMGLYAVDKGLPDASKRMRGIVLNALNSQRADGSVPGCIPSDPTDPKDRLNILHHTKPLLAQAALHGSDADTTWLQVTASDGQTYLDKLITAVTYRETSLWHEQYGLASWYNYMESGADDNVALQSPRIDYDMTAAEYPGFCTTPTKHLIACDVNAFLYRDYLALSELLTRMKDSRAETFRAKAEALRENIVRHLWDETTGSLYTLDTTTGRHITRHSYSNLIPLWAGIFDQTDSKHLSMAQRMIEHHVLDGQKFWSHYGIRTLAKSDPDYNITRRDKPSNWQGPVWPHANILVAEGLAQYGYHDRALELTIMTLQLCLHDLTERGTMHECYDGDTGAPLAVPNFMSFNLPAAVLLDRIQRYQETK
jgi:alpha,alpha-trehalase